MELLLWAIFRPFIETSIILKNRKREKILDNPDYNILELWGDLSHVSFARNKTISTAFASSAYAVEQTLHIT